MEIYQVENLSNVGRTFAGVDLPPGETVETQLSPSQLAYLRRRPEVFSISIPTPEISLDGGLTAFNGIGPKRAEEIKQAMAEYSMSFKQYLESDIAIEQLPDDVLTGLISQYSEVTDNG